MADVKDANATPDTVSVSLHDTRWCVCPPFWDIIRGAVWEARRLIDRRRTGESVLYSELGGGDSVPLSPFRSPHVGCRLTRAEARTSTQARTSRYARSGKETVIMAPESSGSTPEAIVAIMSKLLTDLVARNDQASYTS